MKRPTFRLLATGCSFVVTLLALASCDGRELVAPGRLGGAQVRGAVTQPVSLGSNLLLPPANTSGSPGPSVSLGSVPANTWVVFQVNGSVSGEWNPECNQRPPAWPCPAGAIAQSYTGGADIYAPVTITYTYDQFGPHTGRVLLRGLGEGSAIGLYINDFPSTLNGFLKVNTLTSWDPNFGTAVPSYYKLSGGYTVTATMVPRPFRVVESAPDDSGYVTYTAEALYGLRFQNAPLDGVRPAGAAVWRFLPGDTSSTPAPGAVGWYMYHCEYRLTCRFRPPGPGRMQVAAYVEMRGAYARSEPEAPQCPASSDSLAAVRFSVSGTTCGGEVPDDAKLVLECAGPDDRANRVIRGKEIHCVVSKDPQDAPGDVTVIQWAFEGQPRTDGVPTDLEWSGPMARSGRVTVRGQIGTGRPQERSANISVEKREWTDELRPLQRVVCPPSTIPQGCPLDTPLRTEIELFLQSAATSEPPPVTGAEGRQALALAERLLHSIHGHPMISSFVRK